MQGDALLAVHFFIISYEETQLYHKSEIHLVRWAISKQRGSTPQNGPCSRGQAWDSFSHIWLLTVNTPLSCTTASGSLDSSSESLIPHPVLCIVFKSRIRRGNMKSRTCSWSVSLGMGNQGVGD